MPLIVPEVNADAIAGYTRKNIIANPNCSTAQLVVALKPLHDRAKIKRVVVSTYQSVSGAGKEGMDELWTQTKGIYVPGNEAAAQEVPQADRLQRHSPHRRLHGGRLPRDEEWKMVAETKKILDPKIKVTATCVRVPVFVGHSEAVNVEFEQPITADEARDILREAPGVPGDRQARARRLHHAGSRRPASTPPTSAASARTSRSRTASPCGSSPTTCARAPPSTPCRSPSSW